MSVQTIHLSTIPKNQPEVLQQKDIDSDEDGEIEKLCINQYQEQKLILEELFEGWLQETNAALIEEIDSFIRISLGDKNDPFRHVSSKIIHAAQVVLGMRSSDNKPTLDMIHNHVITKNQNFQIIRINQDFSKKNDLIAVFGEVKRSKQLFLIIEQTETIELSLLEILINYLGTINAQIMILFCMISSASKEKLSQLDLRSRMRVITSIVKKSPENFLNLQSRLLKTNEFKFRFGHNMVDLIYDNFIQCDPTIAQLKYLYEYAMFEHFMKHTSLVTLDRKYLIKVIKPGGRLVNIIRSLKSVKRKESANVDWKSVDSISQFCLRSTEAISKNHEFLVDQIECYLILVKDETNIGFPSFLSDIFGELWNYESLNQSHSFMEALAKLRKYSNESILRRIEAVMANCSVITSKKDYLYVQSILSKYKKKLENNNNCKETREELTTSLQEHAKLLKSPKTFPLYEAIYFDDHSTMIRTIPYSRTDFFKSNVDPNNHYIILCNLINNSPEEISKLDLYNEFKQAVVDLNPSQMVEAQNVLKTRTKANKCLRRSTRTSNITLTKNITTNDEFKDEGLLKAIFIDLIESMELQGLIKTDNRKSKTGLIKRVVWS